MEGLWLQLVSYAEKNFRRKGLQKNIVAIFVTILLEEKEKIYLIMD